uniref:Uncharacterized protein n=1 Tax=Moniliophthora roreri TaxID=221103 RepID=A0A0W0EVU5_MONRR
MESELTSLRHVNEDLREEMNVMEAATPSAALPRPLSSPSLPLPGDSSSCQRVTIDRDGETHGDSNSLGTTLPRSSTSSPTEINELDKDIILEVDDSSSDLKTTKTQKSTLRRGPAVKGKEKVKTPDSRESSELSSLYDENSDEESLSSRTPPPQAAKEFPAEPRLTRSARRERRVKPSEVLLDAIRHYLTIPNLV